MKIYEGVSRRSGKADNGRQLSLPEAAQRLNLAPTTIGNWVKAYEIGKLKGGSPLPPLTTDYIAYVGAGQRIDWEVRVRLGKPFGTVLELLFENKQLIPGLQQLIVASSKTQE